MLAATLLSALATTCFAQSCVTCHDFSSSGGGWTSSPGVTCSGSGDCTRAQNCSTGIEEDACSSGAGRSCRGSADSNPGLFLEQHGGRLLVAAVAPNSPAKAAGVAVGDEVVEINGTSPSRSGARSTWASDRNPSVTEVVIRRNGQTRRLSLQLLTWRELAFLAIGVNPPSESLLADPVDAYRLVRRSLQYAKLSAPGDSTPASGELIIGAHR